jgi:hypothetical protein
MEKTAVFPAVLVLFSVVCHSQTSAVPYRAFTDVMQTM